MFWDSYWNNYRKYVDDNDDNNKLSDGILCETFTDAPHGFKHAMTTLQRNVVSVPDIVGDRWAATVIDWQSIQSVEYN